MIELLNRYDITDRTRKQGSDSAYMSDVMGLLTREKQYSISDGESIYNPFAAASRIQRNTWRNGDIYETENGQGVFLGAINDVGFESTERGRATVVSAREPFANLLDFIIEEGTLISDITIADQYTVSVGAAQATTLTLTNVSSPADIETGDIISFGNYNVPRYAVISASGTPTTSITIDRPLERGVVGAIVRVFRPTTITGPAALKNAFEAAGMSQYIGGSFDTLDTSDTNNQFLIRLFVRIESKIKLSDHIKKIMEMTDLYLTVSPTGIINCFRGMGYDGSTIRKAITTSEVISTCNLNFERQNLFAGYDCLFVSSTNTDVSSGDASSTVVAQWGSKERWQPIDDKGQSITAYSYLYANAHAATYFGTRKLDYNSAPRTRVKMKCKRSPSGTQTLYNFVLGDQVEFTYDMGGGKSLTSEPARVVGYAYNRDQQYYEDLVLELNTFQDTAIAVIDGIGDDEMRYLAAASTLTTTSGSAGAVYVTADKGVYYWRDYVSSAPTVDSDTYYATANGGETRWVRSGIPSTSTQAAKFWINFVGTGTPAIKASYNVTSITDNATGDYTVNLTNATSDAFYAIGSAAGGGTSGAAKCSVDLFVGAGGTYTNRVAPTTTAFRIRTTRYDSADIDADDIHVVGFR